MMNEAAQARKARSVGCAWENPPKLNPFC